MSLALDNIVVRLENAFALGIEQLSGIIMDIAYRTDHGVCFHGVAEAVLGSEIAVQYEHAVDLVFTSPPFPLNRKKKYGNLQGQEYVGWLASFAPIFRKVLKSEGSIVVEVGNTWEPNRPIMSTLALEALLAFLRAGNFHLCQQFVWHNPARLPSPIQWVNVERIRVKDSFTHLWWMAPSDRPKADNRHVLQEYSPAMKKLLRNKKYNPGKRPSEHNIGQTSFLTDNKGAIPSNVIEVANTQASSDSLSGRSKARTRMRCIRRHVFTMPLPNGWRDVLRTFDPKRLPVSRTNSFEHQALSETNSIGCDMTAASGKYLGSKEYLLVYSELIIAARYRGTITYQEVADLMGLPLQGNYMGKEIGLILGEISEDEHKYNRPMLSAVVVNTTGSPGPGFYELAKRFGKLSDDSEEGKRRFWASEKKAVYTTWQKALKSE